MAENYPGRELEAMIGWCVPPMRRIEGWVAPPLGKNLLMVARKPG